MGVKLAPRCRLLPLPPNGVLDCLRLPPFLPPCWTAEVPKSWPLPPVLPVLLLPPEMPLECFPGVPLPKPGLLLRGVPCPPEIPLPPMPEEPFPVPLPVEPVGPPCLTPLPRLFEPMTLPVEPVGPLPVPEKPPCLMPFPPALLPDLAPVLLELSAAALPGEEPLLERARSLPPM